MNNQERIEQLENELASFKDRNQKLESSNVNLTNKLKEAQTQAQAVYDKFAEYETAETENPEMLYLQAKVDSLTECVKSAQLKGLFSRLGLTDQIDEELELGSTFDLFMSRVNDSVSLGQDGNLVFTHDGSEEGFIKRFRANKMNKRLFYQDAFAPYDTEQQSGKRQRVLKESDLLGSEFQNPNEQPYDIVQAFLTGEATLEPRQRPTVLPTVAEPLYFDPAKRRYYSESELLDQ